MFRVSARTVLQLGAELISSDAVAFYELIKNAFDAGAPRVDIDVVVRIPYAAHLSCTRQFRAAQVAAEGDDADGSDDSIDEIRTQILEVIDHSAPHSDALKRQATQAGTLGELAQLLDDANYIDITDHGHGMSQIDLSEIYLTIGTRARLIEKEEQRAHAASAKARPVLGEKGLGRLSAMRLGDCLQVRTARSDDRYWNLLVVDWRWFSHDSDQLIDQIEVNPTRGSKKERTDESGTRIRITALKTRWNELVVGEIAGAEFSRFTDPFSRRSKFQVSLRFNDRTVVIPAFDAILFENAHAVVRAEYSVHRGEIELAGSIDYTARNRQRTFSLNAAELVGTTEVSEVEQLRAVGPFRVEFYWYNRRILEAVEGIGTKRQVQELVNRWSGGLMVFRDGFRVLPYGSPDDDWLDLDRKALASSGYKVNRKQLIGKLDITSRGNPNLIDQSNREGIRDCEEKRVLVKLLKHIVEEKFRAFILNVDDEMAARMSVTFDDIHERVGTEERKMRASVTRLLEKVPAARKEKELLAELNESVKAISTMMQEAEELAESFNKGRTQVIHLAGLGMMVEVLAHELNRVTEHSLATLAEADGKGLPSSATTWVSTLRSQLSTLQKRLKILDPLSTSGRQVKSTFDLIEWVEQVVATHSAQCERHGIECTIRCEPEHHRGGWSVRMVKGMIVQILENLLANSVYWLKQQRKIDKRFKPKIEVVLRPKSREICVVDNGPGVAPSRREEIFQPFITTKPPGEGKGLGLYIAREIATYHDVALFLSDEPSAHTNRLNTFILALGAGKQ